MDRFVIRRSRRPGGLGNLQLENSDTSTKVSPEIRPGQSSSSTLVKGAMHQQHEAYHKKIEDRQKVNTAPADLNGTERNCPNIAFPKDKNGRSFQHKWFMQHPWLEYSSEANAAFCFACRVFNCGASKEDTFTTTGYCDWKHALGDRAKGFLKHEGSVAHIVAMTNWKELQNRTKGDREISTMLSSDMLERNRYYVKSVVEVVQFIALNELAFRGTYDADVREEQGLFSKLFQFAMNKDSKLKEIHKSIPQNAKYSSPEIQNEIIDTLANMVKSDISEDIKTADANVFSLLEDGTRDKKNTENISIGIRYVKNGQIQESLLDMPCVGHDELDAASLTSKTIDILTGTGLDCTQLLAQCYDGASVMKGHNGGVQALLQEKL